MSKKYIIVLLYCFFTLSQYIFFNNITFSKDFLLGFIEVSAIFFGFYIVALSIFATSRFVKSLYKLEIKDKKGFHTTQLHLFLNMYKNGLVLNLLSILYFLFLIFFIDNKWQYENFFLLLVIPIILHNFLYHFYSLTMLIKVIKRDAKNNK